MGALVAVPAAAAADGGAGGGGALAHAHANSAAAQSAAPKPAARTSALHRRQHLAHRLGEADGDGARDQPVADVELLHVGERGHGADVPGGEAMAGVDAEAGGAALLGGGAHARE